MPDLHAGDLVRLGDLAVHLLAQVAERDDRLVRDGLGGLQDVGEGEAALEGDQGAWVAGTRPAGGRHTESGHR